MQLEGFQPIVDRFSFLGDLYYFLFQLLEINPQSWETQGHYPPSSVCVGTITLEPSKWKQLNHLCLVCTTWPTLLPCLTHFCVLGGAQNLLALDHWLWFSILSLSAFMDPMLRWKTLPRLSWLVVVLAALFHYSSGKQLSGT